MKGMLIGTVLALGLVGCAVGTSDPLPAPPVIPSDNPPPQGTKSGNVEDEGYSGKIEADTDLNYELRKSKHPSGGPEWREAPAAAESDPRVVTKVSKPAVNNLE
jgi:hypothetical protein